MNEKYPTETLSGNTINFPNQPSANISRGTIAVLIVLALAALGLIILPRPALYYPNVVINAGNNMQLDFLLNGQQDKTVCESSVTAIVNAITTGCHECRILSQACIKNPSPALRSRFDESPLPVPSARITNGIVTYSAEQADNAPDLALMACHESERQAALKNDQTKVTCYPAGTARPHTLFEKQQEQTGHTNFTLLLGIVGTLIAGLTAAILITYCRHRRAVIPREFPSVIANAVKKSTSNSPHTAIIPTHPWLEKFTLASVDTLILLSTFLALAWPEAADINRWSHLDRATVISYSTVTILTIGWFWLLLEHYARRRPFWDELQDIVRVLITMFMVSGTAAFVAGIDAGGGGSQLIVWPLNFVLIPLGRSGVRLLLEDLGLWQRPTLIIGTGENARDAYLAIKSERGMGYRVLGFVDINRHCEERSDEAIHLHIGPETFPIFDGAEFLEILLSDLGNPQVILALDSLNAPENQTLIQRLLSSHTDIHIIPSIRGLPLFGTQLSHFFSHEVLFLTVRNNLARRGYKWIKRTFDLVTATLLLILLTPLFLVLAFMIRRSGGTAFYGHSRIGRDGKSFKCLKFRSMRPDADTMLKELLDNDPVAKAEWDKDFKLKNDPRITPVGHFLRKTSLDELPQLFNVIRGEMSLVGPRPIVAEELERYGDHKNLYLQGLPGLTGLWQVSGRNDTSYDERVSLDAWYVQNWSLWYDIAILFKTANVVLKRSGAY